MTPKDQILYSLLPQAEGLLLGTARALREIENINKEGAAKTLENAISLLHDVTKLLNHDASISLLEVFNVITIKTKAGEDITIHVPKGSTIASIYRSE